MANYINSTTHSNKLTKEINRTQMKQTIDTYLLTY